MNLKFLKYFHVQLFFLKTKNLRVMKRSITQVNLQQYKIGEATSLGLLIFFNNSSMELVLGIIYPIWYTGSFFDPPFTINIKHAK